MHRRQDFCPLRVETYLLPHLHIVIVLTIGLYTNLPGVDTRFAAGFTAAFATDLVADFFI
jgi:hypothetical protein